MTKRHTYYLRIGFLLAIGLTSFAAIAEDEVARVIPSDSSSRISSFKLNEKEFKVRSTQLASGATQEFIVLEGTYPKPDWGLIWKSRRVPLESDGHFKLAVPVTDRAVNVELVAVGPRGEVEAEMIRLYVPKKALAKTEGKSQSASDRKKVPRKKITLSPGLGYSIISYRETDKPNYSETALTAKITYSNVLFKPNWTYGISGYFTALPVTVTDNTQARFLGLNLRVGYSLPGIREPWRITLFGGWYYTTMFVSPQDFGFRNMAGPQLYPVFRRSLNNGNSIVAYFKYSPVSDQSSILSFSNHELAGGGAYVIMLNNGHPLSLTLDIAKMHMVIKDRVADSESIVDTHSISIGASYGI
ncbi:MAG: hypothetical protein AB1540_06830 [Bdellovibrionota bacterium]